MCAPSPRLLIRVALVLLLLVLVQKLAQTVEADAADDVLEDVDERFLVIDAIREVAFPVEPAPSHTN